MKKRSILIAYALILPALVLLAHILGSHPVEAQSLKDILIDSPTSNADTETIETDVISTENDASTDQEIEQRLNGIFSELDRFQGVAVSVSNSVVTLQGELVSAADIADAVSLASKVEGVVEIDNQLSVTTAVRDRLDSSLDDFSKGSRRFLNNIPILTLALVVIVAGWLFGRYIGSKQSLFQKIAPNRFIANLLGNIVRSLIFALGFYIGLRLLDATELIGTILGAAGIVGLAVGFAVRDTVENYIASILLSLRQPFKTMDSVSIGDIQGKVARLTSRATILVTEEGNHIRVPNAVVYKSIITNYSRNPLRRFDFMVGIDRSTDILTAQKLALRSINDVTGVLSNPGSTVTVEKLGDENVMLLMRAWIDQSVHDLQKVRSEAIRQVKLRFDEAGIFLHESVYKPNTADQQNSTSVDSSADTSRTQVTSGAIGSKNSSLHREADTGEPAQSIDADNMIEKTIEAELEMVEENLLSDQAAHE